MAYIKPLTKEEEEAQALAGQPLQLTSGGGQVLGASGEGGAAQPLQQEQKSPQQAGMSGFTDVARYLEANKPVTKSVSERIAGRLGEEAGATKGKIESLGKSFSEAAKKGTTSLDQQLLERAISAPTQMSPEDMARVQAMRTATYQGPQALEDAEVSQAVKEGERKMGLVGTPQGRKELLYSTAKAPTRGAMALDELLLSQDPEAQKILSEGAGKFKGLTDYLNQIRGTAGTEAETAKKTTEATAQQTAKSLLDAIGKGKTDLETRLAQAQKAAKERAAAAKESFTAKDVTKQQLEDLGISKEDFDKMRGYSDILSKAHGQTFDPLQFLTQRAPSAEITREKVATPEDYARAQALATMAGVDPYLAASAAGKAGTANLDITDFLGKEALGGATNQLKELDTQVWADESEPMDKRRAAGDRWGLGEPYVTPIIPEPKVPPILDVITEPENVRTGIENLVKPVTGETIADLLGGSAGAATLPTKAAKDIFKEIGDIAQTPGTHLGEIGKMIPGVEPVKDILTNPKEAIKDIVSQPQKLVTEPIENVGKAAEKNVKKAVKSIEKALCFSGDTGIQMADGSYKQIMDLDVGDITKGGIIYSFRKSQTDPGTRYNYKNIVVTGSHAVKEDGIWKRVKDSKEALPLGTGGTVYSICTSDHRIWINGIEFADEHETDNYEDLTIDESLDKLNRQSAKEIHYTEVA